MHIHHQFFSGSNTNTANRPPIVILHGLLGCSDNWLSAAKKCSESYPVYIVDLRNHGQSGHDASMTYIDMAQDIENFIMQQGLEAPILIGHSMGGKVAMTVALRQKVMITKLVVVDIAPREYKGEHRPILRVLSYLNLKVQSRSELENQLLPNILSPMLRQFLLKTIRRVKGDDYDGFEFKINLPGIVKNYDAVMGFVDVDEECLPSDIEAAFIKGEKSAYIMPDDESIIRSYFSNSSLYTVSGAGHWVQAENPSGFMDVLKTVLAI